MVIFSTVGLVVSREVNETRDKANEALDRAGAVLHMEEAKAAASDQIQANYQLLLENQENKIAYFDDARRRRESAIAEARKHAGTSQELEWFDELESAAAQFDDNFLNQLVPAWRSGDQPRALLTKKRSDELLQEVANYSSLLAEDFKKRNQEAQIAANDAAAEARSYIIFAAIAGVGLSLLITIIAARRLSRPVRELNEASIAMTHGDLNRRV